MYIIIKANLFLCSINLIISNGNKEYIAYEQSVELDNSIQEAKGCQ